MLTSFWGLPGGQRGAVHVLSETPARAVSGSSGSFRHSDTDTSKWLAGAGTRLPTSCLPLPSVCLPAFRCPSPAVTGGRVPSVRRTHASVQTREDPASDGADAPEPHSALPQTTQEAELRRRKPQVHRSRSSHRPGPNQLRPKAPGAAGAGRPNHQDPCLERRAAADDTARNPTP